MNLRQLEAFVHVAKCSSFSQAAKELYLTQPTVSAHIAALEKELGSRLFIRNTKSVSLTEDGIRLCQYACQMLELEEQVYLAFGRKTVGIKKDMVIATSTIPAQYLLPEILKGFQERYPQEKFRVIETDSAGVVKLIREFSADIGFTGTKLDVKSCSYIPFYEDELVIITPNTKKYEKLKEAMEEKRCMQWICEEPLIMREEGSGTRREAERQLKRLGIGKNELKITASIENQETIKKYVAGGMGISVVSRLAAEDAVKRNEILEIPIPLEHAGRQLNIVFGRQTQPSDSVKHLIDYVKEQYKIS